MRAYGVHLPYHGCRHSDATSELLRVPVCRVRVMPCLQHVDNSYAQVVMQIMQQLDEPDAALANALCEALLQRMLPAAQTANPICYKYAFSTLPPSCMQHRMHTGLWPTCSKPTRT